MAYALRKFSDHECTFLQICVILGSNILVCWKDRGLKASRPGPVIKVRPVSPLLIQVIIT